MQFKPLNQALIGFIVTHIGGLSRGGQEPCYEHLVGLLGPYLLYKPFLISLTRPHVQVSGTNKRKNAIKLIFSGGALIQFPLLIVPLIVAKFEGKLLNIFQN